MKLRNKLIGWFFASLLLAGGAVAQLITVTHHSPSFINGCNIFIPTNGVIYFGNTNVMFIDNKAQAQMSFSNNVVYYTNAVGTTSNVFFAPNCFLDVPCWSDALGNVQSNITLTIVLNSTNYFLPGLRLPNPNSFFGPQYNAGVLTNSSGNPLTAVIYTNIPVATSTNQLTLTFVKTGDGDYASYGNLNGTNGYNYQISTFDTNSVFSVVINNTFYMGNSGANPLVVTTNLPGWFTTGAKAIRLYSITSGVGLGTSSGQILNVCKLSGWY